VGVNEFGESTPHEIPGGTPGPDNRLTDLEAKLTEAFGETERLREEWLRAKAETENVRAAARRMSPRPTSSAWSRSPPRCWAVKDSLEPRSPVENTSIESFKEGVELTARQLDAVFDKFSLKPVAPPVGEKSDPAPPPGHQPGESDAGTQHGGAVLQKGYTLARTACCARRCDRWPSR
jgi:molecular chaperone GrpE